MSPTDPGLTPSPDEQQAPMQEEMVDHPDVRALVAQARDELADGNDKQAARLLTDAAYHTHDPELERRDPRQRPAVGGGADLGVDLGEVGVSALGEVARERLRVRQQVVQRAPGHVTLVERERGVAALI